MKVVFFSSTGRTVGGAIMCLKEILLYCIEHQIEPFVILRSRGDFEEYLKQIGVRYKIVSYHDWLRPKKDHGGIRNELKWKIKEIQNIFSDRKVYKILQKEKPDVYHLNVIYNPCGAELAHMLGIPVVWHLREFAEINEDTPFFRNREEAYKLIAQSDRIVCVSKCIKEFYSQFMPSDKMTMIYDGIVMPTDEVKMRKKNEVFHITLSGGSRVKGHRDLIEAARVLLGRGIENFYIKIAGRFVDEEYLARLKELVIEYGLDSRIEFIGFQKHMDTLWQETDIAVVCSRFESFGLSICEAMARAIPVICAKSTGSYEVTNRGEYAKLYEIGNYKQLSDALFEVMENYKTSAEYAVQVAQKVRRIYSINKSCEELVGVFRKLVRIS